MKLTIRTLYVFLVFLNLLDIATTYYGLQLGAGETNPVTLWYWEKIGSGQMAWLRLGFLALFGILTAVTLKVASQKSIREEEVAASVIWCILFAATLFYLVIVTRNLEIIIRYLTM